MCELPGVVDKTVLWPWLMATLCVGMAPVEAKLYLEKLAWMIKSENRKI